MSITIVIVEKPGTIKSLTIKEFVEEELFKKCGFKKNDGFAKQTEWSVKTGGKKYAIAVFAKTDGRANCENKYDFPPPIDNTLFFGNCAIAGMHFHQVKSLIKAGNIHNESGTCRFFCTICPDYYSHHLADLDLYIISASVT